MTEPEQLAFDAMPRRLFACTPSRLATFGCPRQYRFTYLKRPAPPRGLPWARSTVGAVAHVALHRWWLLPRSQRVPEQGIELVERNWSSAGFRDDRQSARTCELVADWVAAYLREHVDPADEPVGVERTVAARTARLALSGRVDRIDDRAGELVVVDYKTGRRPPTVSDVAASAALALYALGVRQTLHRDCRRVELHHLPTGTVAAFEHTEETLAAALARAERTAEGIETAADRSARGVAADVAYPPVPSPSCAWCDFRRQCPAGRAASEELVPWAGLPDAVA
ncbi:PD-(D/E)XK nuclease superfamily protein [Jatrophihabitans endophyticus]|uniref:PD-(D/E)XK nuclease superfamily protein n=1 Tax=Jatrophihabitans endophyticus TaxID=1206085 RepID=A0A1M5EWA1_9ACTN|nr:PD-(D/E)XK nuclease family protein [Jatrophihabitans endophyticus]SHF83322.1 PD-(D/E)XK nuclease superfamily protein [Jatrophihabitans endophyticus]